MERIKIVIPDSKTVADSTVNLKCFQELGDVVEYELSNAENLPERVQNADIILCNKAPMNKTILQTAERLKYIGLFLIYGLPYSL